MCLHAIGPDLMQCIFRANKMADARITNVDTRESTDVSCQVEYIFSSVSV